MIPLLTRDEVRAIDHRAIHVLGLPGVVLMENAGRGAAEIIAREMRGHLGRVVVVAGSGNNGGDGYVVARRLHLLGVPCEVASVASSRPNTDAAVMSAAAERMGVPIVEVHTHAQLAGVLERATLVLDAVLGTGLDRPVSGYLEEMLREIDRAASPRVALDLPSGLDANTGQALGFAPHAQLTVTFAAHKRGLHAPPGCVLAGRTLVADIGVGVEAGGAGLLEAHDVAPSIAPRPIDAHKASVGRVLVVAGSSGTSGAALLAGRGALRAGAGLVTLASRADLDSRVVELMTARIPAPPAKPSRIADDADALCVGPGLGRDTDGMALARTFALEVAAPAVLDADALTAFAGDVATLRSCAGPRVLTPHPGEAARLLAKPTSAIAADRFAAACEIASLANAVTVLKGVRTIIAAPDGRLAVCPRGTPALATAGTGDVLSGVVAALLASGRPAWDAACAAVWLHAVAGELASRGLDRGLIASEVADAIPRAVGATRRRAASRLAGQ